MSGQRSLYGYWIGYFEKKSNANLDDFTANAGSENYTFLLEIIKHILVITFRG
jgi:hypothetical protein